MISSGGRNSSDALAGGWDPTSNKEIGISSNLQEEIEQAFKNVDITLKDAGGKGWSQVYRVNSYHTHLDKDVTRIMGELFGKWMPDHRPIWTEIGVKQLGDPKMHIEIEVVAHVDE